MGHRLKWSRPVTNADTRTSCSSKEQSEDPGVLSAFAREEAEAFLMESEYFSAA